MPEPNIPPGEAGGGQLAAIRIRAELARIRDALEAVERELAGLADTSAAPSARQRSERYYELLIDVYERGPHGVSGEQMDELARRHGYDRRGLNGYFVGSRAPLERRAGRVVLSQAGAVLVTERLRLALEPE